MGCGKDKICKNKGVNTLRNERAHISDTESGSTGHGRSISKVKNEVKTVIELMGPSTPNFDSSTVADNEDSFYSSNMISIKRQNEVITEEYSVSTDCPCTDKTLPPDITFDEDTNVSILAAKNSNSADPKIGSPRLVCPPPPFPANIVFNPECMCPQIADYMVPRCEQHLFNQAVQAGDKNTREKTGSSKNIMYNLFRSFTTNRFKDSPFKSGEYYKINIKQSSDKHSVPQRLVFDLVDALPVIDDSCPCDLQNKAAYPSKEDFNYNQNLSPGEKEDNYNNERKGQHQTTFVDNSETTRVDVYYFDHGNSNYLRTTDSPPVVATEALAEKTERYTTKFWAEIFGSLHIGIAFCTSFILQLIRFLLYSILRPLTIGLMQLLSDYFFKPFLATLFNAVIQPPLIFLYNIATSLRDLLDPLAEAMGFFLRELAFLVKACRVVEVRKEYCGKPCKAGERRDGTQE